jgi:hypothetical protein
MVIYNINILKKWRSGFKDAENIKYSPKNERGKRKLQTAENIIS